jgi:hypothetical protein
MLPFETNQAPLNGMIKGSDMSLKGGIFVLENVRRSLKMSLGGTRILKG